MEVFTKREELKKEKSDRRKQRNRNLVDYRKIRRSQQFDRHRQLTCCFFSTKEEMVATLNELKLYSLNVGDVVDAARESSFVNNYISGYLQTLREILSIKNIYDSINIVLTEGAIRIDIQLFITSFLFDFIACLETVLNLEIFQTLNAIDIRLVNEVFDLFLFVLSATDLEHRRFIANSNLHNRLLALLQPNDIVSETKALYCMSIIAAIDEQMKCSLGKHLLFIFENSFIKPNETHENQLQYFRSISISMKVVTHQMNAELNNDRVLIEFFNASLKLWSINDTFITMNVILSIDSMVARGSAALRETVQHTNAINILIKSLNPKNHLVSAAILKTLNNLISTDGSLVPKLFQQNFFDLLHDLISKDKSLMLILSIINIDQSTVRFIAESGIVTNLMQVFEIGNNNTQNLIFEIIKVLISSDNIEVTMQLLNCGLINSLAVQLSAHDPNIIIVALDVYDHLLLLESKRLIEFKVLKQCKRYTSVTNALNKLCSHPNDEIAERAIYILENYIERAEDVECFDYS